MFKLIKKSKSSFKRGFSLLELIVALGAISILSIFIYKAFFSMQEIDRKSNMMRDMTNIKGVMFERLKNIEILEGTLTSSSKVYLNELEVYDKNKFSRLLDTNEKQEFWGIEKSIQKKYIYPQSKVYQTAYGDIPYTDFYVIMLGPKLDKIFRRDPELLNNELFVAKENKGLISRFHKKFIQVDPDEESEPEEPIDPLDPLVDATLTDGYPIIQDAGFNRSTFKSEVKNIIMFKVSTQEIVLNKYNESIEILKNYSKNLKDWGSIQMSMYENVIAKYGGSYNIGYYVSLGVNNSNINSSDTTFYGREMLYSSIALDSADNPIRQAVGNREGFMEIPENELSNTKYGIVVCNSGCEGSVSSSNITSIHDLGEDNSIENIPGEGLMNVTNAIKLDSENLLPGSKLILGINGTSASIHNPFGSKYKYYFTNLKDWEVEWTSTGEDGTTHSITANQNVPSVGNYAPFSSTMFTTFPWLVDETKNNNTDGYVDVKVFPELR